MNPEAQPAKVSFVWPDLLQAVSTSSIDEFAHSTDKVCMRVHT